MSGFWLGLHSLTCFCAKKNQLIKAILYRWPLNKTDLNCANVLIWEFFQYYSSTQYEIGLIHRQRTIDMDSQLQIMLRFSVAQMVDACNTCIVQGSIVLGKSLKE